MQSIILLNSVEHSYRSIRPPNATNATVLTSFLEYCCTIITLAAHSALLFYIDFIDRLPTDSKLT